MLTIGVVPNRLVPGNPPEPIVHNPASGSPYIHTFPVSKNSSDYSPYLISPASNRTVWIVAVKSRNGPPLSQIFNYTIRANATAVLAQPLADVPSAILYNQTQGKARVWFVEGDNLSYYDPVAKNTTIEYTFPSGSTPESMSIDNLGRIWLTLLGSNQIAMYDPAQHAAPKYYNLQSPQSEPVGIALAPDQSVWFTEANGSRIGHLISGGLQNYELRDYPTPAALHIIFPIQIAVARNGTVWFTDHGTNQFGSFNPTTNKWTVMPIGYCSEGYNPDCAVGLPNAISFDRTGTLWFSEHFAGRIARYDPADGVLTEYTVPASSPPLTWWMQPGPGNLVWFTAYGTGDIGYVNASVPVPINLNSTNAIDLQQGTTQTLSATLLNPQNAVWLNVSANDIDSPLGSSPLLSGRGLGQIGPSPNPVAVTFSITAAWNLPIGDRNIALTAYTAYVDVNAFVTVHVLSHVYLVQTFVPFLGIGLAASSVAGSSVLYWRRSRNANRDEEDERMPS